MYRLQSDGRSSNRLGIRGVEDMGGGLTAGFWLEGAVAADTGTQPLASIDGGRNNAAGNFQRRATVSLMGGFGELRLGRDKVPTNLSWDEFDPFRDTGVGRSSRLSAASGIGSYAFSRANNAVGYFTPAMGGAYDFKSFKLWGFYNEVDDVNAGQSNWLLVQCSTLCET